MRFVRRHAVALVALVFAMTGTGIAASRYIITSTSQIKPSVLQELRSGPVAHAATLTVKRYANRIVTQMIPKELGATRILEVPGIAKLTALTCEEGSVQARATNLGTGTDLFTATVTAGGGGEANARYFHSWTTTDTLLNTAGGAEETVFKATSGTGTASLIAELRLVATTYNKTDCVFAATAIVYKG